VSDRAVLSAAARLTARDRTLIRCVGEHRVLTTTQVAALGFGSVITARHRLAALTEAGALRRFRPHLPVGSAPWHYLLGPVGALLLGTEDRDDRKWATVVRADRQIALERSQRLAHMTGANWFFIALARHARHDTGHGTELREWLNEAQAEEWVLTHARYISSGQEVPRPDGLGVWAEDGRETAFFLEHDTGSERLAQLAGKLPGYGDAAKHMADRDVTCPLLLFCFPTPRREQAARRTLAPCPDTPGLRIATTAIDPEHTSPAGPVWLPLTDTHTSGQVALSALDTAIPDPWARDTAPTRNGSGRRPYRPKNNAAATTTSTAKTHPPAPFPDDTGPRRPPGGSPGLPACGNLRVVLHPRDPHPPRPAPRMTMREKGRHLLTIPALHIHTHPHHGPPPVPDVAGEPHRLMPGAEADDPRLHGVTAPCPLLSTLVSMLLSVLGLGRNTRCGEVPPAPGRKDPVRWSPRLI
jgi:hypothetical protein